MRGSDGRNNVAHFLERWWRISSTFLPATLQPGRLVAWWPSAALLAGPLWPLFVVVLDGAVNQQLAQDTGLQLRKAAEGEGEGGREAPYTPSSSF